MDDRKICKHKIDKTYNILLQKSKQANSIYIFYFQNTFIFKLPAFFS